MGNYIEPNFNHCAVVTIDTQNDFSLPGAIAEIKGTHEVLLQMESILETCRRNQIPIIHVIRLYKEDGSNVDICRKEMIESGADIVRPGSTGADLVSSIKPLHAEELNSQDLLNGKIQCIGDLEWAMYKPRWGAFYQTHLEDFLREKEIDTLIFIGCNFPNCPRTSIYQASERDFKVVMVEDAISGVYSKGIDEITNIGVKVYTTNRLLEELENISKDE
ncbi:cysteine hydrolase family protein [Paenibacillus macquariensis]|uniref:Nicotinamidase-related amidase n=1 Tax=Paenibacillus macquariensis TaxID=948756 RepID=A0ABY1JMG0_9BACL|nr:isochorismatase family cysteine hydrolase [Paenibacillus macquariensis]MEC0092314.1 cysteine hydrolase [Paenibacillus macquariensis]OAB37145.1 isochorismatase [Paenibacillus macquariensis subsp. macquariensis]SIQ46390.1 Nicotinamidase-related amidase [Paenibacillus macquariensis]